jgi:hypothetical protein
LGRVPAAALFIHVAALRARTHETFVRLQAAAPRLAGADVPLAEAPRVNRTIALLSLASLVLAGCKEVKPDSVPLIHGSTNIAIHNVKYYSSNPGNMSSGEGSTYYVVCQVTFTNTLGFDAAPEPKNFQLVDPLGNTYIGVDGGSAALVGISNYRGIVKKDDKQDYTIAFHVPANVSGAIFYAPF